MEQEGATAAGVTGYQIDDLIINLGQQRVTRDGTEIPLPHLSFDLLVTLAQAAPNFVSFDHLTQRVWPGLVIAPETISQRIKLVRDALGDDAHAPRYIAGIRGRGYRLVAAVRPLADRPQINTLDSARDLSPAAPAPASVGPSALPAYTQVVPVVGRRLHPAIITVLAVLAVALTYVVVDRFRVSKRSAVVQPMASTQQETARDTSTVIVTAFHPPLHSIAVLPFVNMSGDKEQEYFSDGLTEELLNDLARVNELQVVARTSSFSFKGKDVDLGTIARKLNVAAILEGSVRRSAHMVRITAQLNSAITGYHLWSQTYDREFGDVLKLQTEIGDAVASALKITLLGDVAARIELGGTHDAAAFDAYLRARKAHRAAHAGKDLQTAIAGYSEAIRQDPNYALAFANRSIALRQYAGSYETAPAVRQTFEKAHQDALRAIALAPDLSEGHLALAFYLEDMLDFARANDEYARALALGPGNARVLQIYGAFAVFIGRT